jgi:hypothetical protein
MYLPVFLARSFMPLIGVTAILLSLGACTKDIRYHYDSDDITPDAKRPVRDRNRIIQVRTPETVNSFAGHWCCFNDGYLYGTDSRDLTFVQRKTESGQSVEKRGYVTSLDPSYYIDYKIYAATKPGLIFVLVNSNDGYHMLRSTDGAATFKKVFTFGEGNGAGGKNAPDVRILRGMLELTNDVPSGGGKGTLFIPEYNVCKGRIAGSVNDRVRIMKSTDDGETWSKIVEWNTNGTNQVGHIHAMKQDPYTGEIYICVGDDNSKSGIIKWDGVSAWTDNTGMQTIKQLKGFKVFTGAQRYRVCDVLFDENSFYVFTDTQDPNNPGGAESGIWKGSKDFSSFTRVDNKIYDFDHMHVGWFGEKIGNTFVFTTAREYTDATYRWKELNTRVYSSNDGTHWVASGVLNWPVNGSLNKYLYNVFSHNDKLYIDCVSGAGHNSTIQCTLTKVFKSYEEPTILHPVFFVGTWNSPGNDAASGTNADAPKKTLAGMLNNRSICVAARVRIAEGFYAEPEINPVWNSSQVLQGQGPVVIEGGGMNATHLSFAGRSGITLSASRTMTNESSPVVFKDVSMYMAAIAGSSHNRYIIDNTDTHVKTYGCRIGSIINDFSPLIRLGTEGSSYTSENSYHVAAEVDDPNTGIIAASAGKTSIEMKNCIILNASDAFRIDQSSTELRLKNCTFYNIKRHAAVFAGDNNRTFIKNCIFLCGSAPIVNTSGSLTSEIDYNLFNKPNINVQDGTFNLPPGTDPEFSDVTSQNFHLRSSTPCRSKGIYLKDVGYDFTGRQRNDPPTIGAFEW